MAALGSTHGGRFAACLVAPNRALRRGKADQSPVTPESVSDEDVRALLTSMQELARQGGRPDPAAQAEAPLDAKRKMVMVEAALNIAKKVRMPTPGPTVAATGSPAAGAAAAAAGFP